MGRKNLTTVLITVCVVLALVVPAFTAAWAEAPSSKPIELSLALMMPSTHTRWARSLAPWIQMLEERAKGKIKIVPYFAGSLAKGSEIYAAVSQGIADLGEISTAHSPGRFRLAEIFQVPGLPVASSVATSRLHWHLFQAVPEFAAQYAETKVITVYNYGGGANVIMSTTPIHTMQDLKGKKLNIYGGPIGTGVAAALGFTAINMPIPDVYLAVEKGVMDGVISHVSLIVSRRYGEITKYVTYGPPFGSTPFLFIMNSAKWNALPPDVQKVFDELGGVYAAEFFGKNFDSEADEVQVAGVKKFGCEFYTLAPNELAKWNKALEGVQEDWVKRTDAKGLAATKVMEEYRHFARITK